MKITRPQITHQNNQIIYQVGVESARGNETLWYSLDEKFGKLLSNSSDAALVALFIPAMAMGEDIHVAGTISNRLLYNLSRPLQILLRHVIPSLRQIRIHPNDVSSGRAESARGVATGFSGGIDSFCTLADHFFSTSIADGFKVTHLLFNNVGSHGSGGERLFQERYQRLLPAAELIGLPFLMINSNLDSFYGKGLGFQQTHTPRNASIALLLQGAVGRYMYSSTYNYLDVFVGSTYDMAYSDAITLPLLSTEALDALSVGGEYTRVEKTLRVAELPVSYMALDVCVNAHNTGGYTNCSTCWKCLRTLATLEIAGYLEPFSNSFDLNAYRIRREKYFATLLGSDDPLLREVVQFAKDRNHSFPLSSRLLHYSGAYPMARLSKRVLRKVRMHSI